MQNQFNLTRFIRLFKKHTLEHYKYYFMSVIVLIGALTLIMGFVANVQKYPLDLEEQSIFFIVGLLASGTFFTSTVFSNLSDKRSAIAALTLPASHFEKYFLAWLYSFVIFLVVYVLSYYLVLTIVVNLDDWQGQPKKILNLFDKEHQPYLAFLVYIFLHALTIWGAVFYQKMHFIKTAFTFFLSALALGLLNYSLIKAMLGTDIRTAMPFGSVVLEEAENQFLNISEFEDHKIIILIGFMLMALMLWLASFMRLKEKQV